MDRSAIILAGGSSDGFGEDKGLIELAGKPLVWHVVDAVKGLTDEVIVVVSTQECADAYAKVVSQSVRLVVDAQEPKSPLAAAKTGLENAGGQHSLLLPVGSPFVSREVVSLLFECGVGKSAAVPRWPNNEVEPLQAVYETQRALEAAKGALDEGEFDVQAMLDRLRGVRYISTLVLEQIDPNLRSFFKIKTPVDLKKAQAMLRSEKQKSSKRKSG